MKINDLFAGQELPEERPKWYNVVIHYYITNTEEESYIRRVDFQDDRYWISIAKNDYEWDDTEYEGGHDEIESIKKWYEMRKRKEKIQKLKERIYR